MPNTIAYIALFGFPLVAWFLFRRYGLVQAAVLTILIGYLFLPEKTGVNLPVLPTIDKKSMPAICALIFAAMRLKADRRLAIRRGGAPVPPAAQEASQDATGQGRTGQGATRLGATGGGRTVRGPAAPRAAQARRGDPEAAQLAAPLPPPAVGPAVGKAKSDKMVLVIIAALLLSTIITFLTNRSGLTYGPVRLPAIRPYDMPAMMLNFIVMLLPFWVGWQFLRGPEASRTLLRMLAISGLVYACLVLFEVRMAPQLNTWIYGFFPHGWQQHLRAGGFRPIVFLAHGLRVGIYLSVAVMAAASLMRLEQTSRGRMRWGLATAFLLATLLMSKNLGATGITLLMLGVIFFVPQRMKLLFAGAISAVVLFYPMARALDVVPTQAVAGLAAKINTERAGSLEFRFNQEDILLQRAMQKPVAGWGIWGRSRVYDTETGEDISVTDGTWIIFFGMHGWIGYLGIFGLLCVVPIRMGLRSKTLAPNGYDIALVVLLAGNLIDLLPNSSLVPPVWLVAGALWGRYAALRQGRETHMQKPALHNSRAGHGGPDARGRPEQRIRRSSPDRLHPSPRA